MNSNPVASRPNARAPRPSTLRHEAHDSVVVARGVSATVAVGSGEVESAVGSFRHIAYASVLAFEQTFLADDAATVEHDALKTSPGEAAEEVVALELLKGGAAVERPARGRAGGRVFEQRRLHALLRRAVVYDGPAVVLPLLDDVQLVAAAGAVEARGAVLGLEQEIRAGLPVNALRVAVAVRPDFGAHILLTDERVVGRYGGVVVEAKNFSAKRVESLRDLARGGVARRDVELAVGGEAQTRAGVELRGGD